MPEALLKLDNVVGGYTKGHQVLKGINLEVSKNEVVAITGQNGAGKSSIAKAIMGMLPYIDGEISFKGYNISGLKTHKIAEKKIGFFMQGGTIFPHLTMTENLHFAGRNIPKDSFLKKVGNLKKNINLLNDKSRYEIKASYLSGGEKHQLALAMVLLDDPELLLLDEPSAGLSPKNVDLLYRILDKVWKKNETSILLIEQNKDQALKFASKSLFIKNGKLI